jgi:hypothetical protein
MTSARSHGDHHECSLRGQWRRFLFAPDDISLGGSSHGSPVWFQASLRYSCSSHANVFADTAGRMCVLHVAVDVEAFPLRAARR